MCKAQQAKLPLPHSAQEDTDLFAAFKALGAKSGALETVSKLLRHLIKALNKILQNSQKLN